MKIQAKKTSPTVKMPWETLMMLPTPSNISYLWNMGSMLGINLMVQIMTGLMISMHFSSHISMAFESTTSMTRNLSAGQTFRSIHANGASTFFMLIYIHIGRGMMTSSFKKSETWSTGTALLLLLMATAFMGYVLPWGQMSLWGATVITNLASAIPMLGPELVKWLWGGFAVGNPTLNRFLSIHFMLPFLMTAMMIIHLMTLHKSGSSNPTGLDSNKEKSSFHPMFSWKDLTMPTITMSIFMVMCMKTQFTLMDPENFMTANPMVTPIHIQPEWYFLFAYAILRSIPNKLGGVLALLASIMIITTLTAKKTNKSSSKFKPNKKMSFWMTVAAFTMLTWSGSTLMEEPFTTMSKAESMMYFYLIIICLW